MPICRVCGEDYEEDQMATDDVCINCDCAIVHDAMIDDGQLF